ncbi:MAG: hypothetical protein M9889_01835 [Shinella sp.]|nr:hypothetical protein [Shinella sp.]
MVSAVRGPPHKVGIYALLRTLIMLFPVEREELSFVIALGRGHHLLGARRRSGKTTSAGCSAISSSRASASCWPACRSGSPGGTGGAIFTLHSMVVMTGLYMWQGLAGRLGTFDLSRLGGLLLHSALFSRAVAGAVLRRLRPAAVLRLLAEGRRWPRRPWISAPGGWRRWSSSAASDDHRGQPVFLLAYWRSGRCLAAEGHSGKRAALPCSPC